MTEKIPALFALIPNKNGVEHLNYSLESLCRTDYPNCRFVMIDDGSDDDSIRFVSDRYPDVDIIRNKRSSGFAGAVNSGVLLALEQGADYIAVCNNDIKVWPDWVSMSIHILDGDENVGLVGFDEVLKEADALFYDWTPGSGITCKNVTRLPGCLYVCSARAIQRIGLFDEGYFMYGEDNDFFARLIKAGYTLLQTNVPVWHYGEGSSGKKSLKTTWLAYRNSLRYAIKNETPGGIMRMLLSIINQGCNPFLSKRFNDPNFKRLRRYNITVNFGLFLGGCLWNLLNVVSTLRARNQKASQLTKY